ncbi:MAG: c-type cytochrome [Calditrichia bacterium]
MLAKLLKWTGIIISGLLILLLFVGGGLYLLGGGKLNKTWHVQPAKLDILTDSSSIASGRHLVGSRMCMECHGDNLGGKEFIPGGPMGVLPASNLTSGKGGIAPLTDEQWIRAIRHGVGKDNRGLVIMPSEIFFHLSDSELANMVAYLKQLPPIDNELQPRAPGPLMRILANFGKIMSVENIPHESKLSTRSDELVAENYGAHLAKLCVACHGKDFSGGLVVGEPGTPPSRNITTDPKFGIGDWSKQDFLTALRKGRRPDGEKLSEAMPQSIGLMSNEELDALWDFLQTVAPVGGEFAKN